ncbi:MAG: hypothetical protein IPO65_16875 [Saprospiraceae bacterium]|nr:hypothetical protein [Saprospiraceae bacterium]
MAIERKKKGPTLSVSIMSLIVFNNKMIQKLNMAAITATLSSALVSL